MNTTESKTNDKMFYYKFRTDESDRITNKEANLILTKSLELEGFELILFALELTDGVFYKNENFEKFKNVVKAVEDREGFKTLKVGKCDLYE
jgi:hypothetical protein